MLPPRRRTVANASPRRPPCRTSETSRFRNALPCAAATSHFRCRPAEAAAATPVRSRLCHTLADASPCRLTCGTFKTSCCRDTLSCAAATSRFRCRPAEAAAAAPVCTRRCHTLDNASPRRITAATPRPLASATLSLALLLPLASAVALLKPPLPLPSAHAPAPAAAVPLLRSSVTATPLRPSPVHPSA